MSKKVYVKVVDLAMQEELKARTGSMGKKSLPMVSTPADLCNFYVTPARHQAYSSFWLYLTALISGANVMIWIYF